MLIRRPHRGHQAVRFLPVGSPWSPSLLGFMRPGVPPPVPDFLQAALRMLADLCTPQKELKINSLTKPPKTQEKPAKAHTKIAAGTKKPRKASKSQHKHIQISPRTQKTQEKPAKANKNTYNTYIIHL